MADVFKKKIAANINKIRAFGLIDNVTSHSILHLLNKPPDRRTRQEIEMYLPNLVHGTNCLRNVQKGTKIHYYSNNYKVGVFDMFFSKLCNCVSKRNQSILQKSTVKQINTLIKYQYTCTEKEEKQSNL